MLPVPETRSTCPAATVSREVPVVGRVLIVPESVPPSSKASVASPLPKVTVLVIVGLSERFTASVPPPLMVSVPPPSVPVEPPSPSRSVPVFTAVVPVRVAVPVTVTVPAVDLVSAPVPASTAATVPAWRS